MFALVVRFALHPGHADEFDALVSRTLTGIAGSEPGTHVYLTHASPARPDERVFYECYTDQAAFDAHEREPHTRRFLAEREQHLTGPPEVTWLTATDGVIAAERVAR